ncbi:unnamed protein product [Effrenium voratum]|nr:unnamed protein product [Effrenium voratum]
MAHSRLLLSSGLQMHVVQLPAVGEARGTVLCLHGFPDTWFGWRHQMPAFSQRGWHVVVPDLRGYGETEVPKESPAQYQMKELCEDLLGLLEALLLRRVVVLGHDWGGSLAWTFALQFPQRVTAVGAVCTPFFPNNPAKNPWHSMREKPGRFDYQMWFQNAEAEAELSEDPEYTVKCIIRGTGENEASTFNEAFASPTERGGLLKGLPPKELCPRSEILSEEELRYYAAQFRRSGFFGGLSWYRNVERNWQWMRSTAGQKIQQEAFILTAGRDPTLRASMVDSLKMKDWVPRLRHVHIEDAGHWVLQEAPKEATTLICEWLDHLPSESAMARL